MTRGQVEVEILLGTVTRDEDGLNRVSYQERMVLQVPGKEHVLQARLMLCTCMQDAEHPGVRNTII